jgi:hypothetical protein
VSGAENAWMLEGARVLRLSEVISHGDDRWAGRPSYKRLRCPACSDTYQHVTNSWQHIPGHDNYEAGWGGRGDLVIITMWGECGHTWEICFGSHKGETICFVRVPHDQERAA